MIQSLENATSFYALHKPSTKGVLLLVRGHPYLIRQRKITISRDQCLTRADRTLHGFDNCAILLISSCESAMETKAGSILPMHLTLAMLN